MKKLGRVALGSLLGAAIGYGTLAVRLNWVGEEPRVVQTSESRPERSLFPQSFEGIGEEVSKAERYDLAKVLLPVYLCSGAAIGGAIGGLSKRKSYS